MSRVPRIQDCLGDIYGPRLDPRILQRLDSIMTEYAAGLPRDAGGDLSARDVILITYPDQVYESGVAPLITLADLADRYLAGLVSGIHLLPFYPSSSDDGFAVIDYRRVAPEHGSWRDVQRLGRSFRLMFDAVINHVSAESPWFREFLLQNPRYRDYFIQVKGTPDLSAVVRPRAQPLLTTFRRRGVPRGIWTTFGPDQIDLNYQQPDVLLDILDVLLFYVRQGASIIRLDAVPYLWKEIGTSCINLPQTHAIVRLMRAVLDQVAPQARLLVEANVPAVENQRYFGDGSNEAHLIYNFALAPLLLHAFRTGNTEALAHWAAGLDLPSSNVSYFNLLASHDGIPLNPLNGILSDEEVATLVSRIEAAGNPVSRRTAADGTEAPYEINANYFDALDAVGVGVVARLKLERFLTAHAIMMALKGLPGLYFHSLFGSRGWLAGVAQTGRLRTINREKLEFSQLEAVLGDSASERAQVFDGLRRLLRIRSRHVAFSPRAGQRVHEVTGSVFAFSRGDESIKERVLCVYNVSADERDFRLDGLNEPMLRSAHRVKDLFTDLSFDLNATGSITLGPYQSLWLMIDTEE